MKLTNRYIQAQKKVEEAKVALSKAQEEVLAAEDEMLCEMMRKIEDADDAGRLKYKGAIVQLSSYYFELDNTNKAKAWMLLGGYRISSRGKKVPTTIGPVYSDDPDLEV